MYVLPLAIGSLNSPAFNLIVVVGMFVLLAFPMFFSATCISDFFLIPLCTEQNRIKKDTHKKNTSKYGTGMYSTERITRKMAQGKNEERKKQPRRSVDNEEVCTK